MAKKGSTHRTTEQLLAEAEAKAARLRQRQRRERDRRLLLQGVALEQWAGDDPQRLEQLRAILDAGIRSERDRRFLGLPTDNRQTE